MKTNTKIELGILAFCLLGSFIFQLYVKNVSNFTEKKDLVFNGQIESKEYSIEPFQKLEIGMHADVVYKNGSPKLEIETAEGWLESLDINENEGMLSIDMQGNDISSTKFRSTVTIYNNQPLEYLSLFGTTSMDFQFSDSLNMIQIVQRQISKLRGNLVAKTVNLTVADASECEISGHSDQLNLNLRNASNTSMKGFITSNLILEMTDAAHGTLTVSNFITAETYGASRMEISGSPRIKGLSTKDASRIDFINDMQIQE